MGLLKESYMEFHGYGCSLWKYRYEEIVNPFEFQVKFLLDNFTSHFFYFVKICKYIYTTEEEKVY